jgi:hypothetical protein
LVRPDRYVGFRAADAVSDPAAALAGAFDQILATGAGDTPPTIAAPPTDHPKGA